MEILVPRDITDPLNLKGGSEEGGAAGVLLSPPKSKRKHRYKHHGGGGASADKSAMFPPTASGEAPGGSASDPGGTFRSLTPPCYLPGQPTAARGGSVCASPLSCELNTAITCREDLAPSPRPSRRHTHPPPGSAHKPGLPADGRQRRRRRTTSVHSDPNVATATTITKFQTPLADGAKAGRYGSHRGKLEVWPSDHVTSGPQVWLRPAPRPATSEGQVQVPVWQPQPLLWLLRFLRRPLWTCGCGGGPSTPPPGC